MKPWSAAALPERGSPGKETSVEKGVKETDSWCPCCSSHGQHTVLGQSLGCPKQGVAGPMNKAGSGVTAQISEMTKSF